MPTCPNCGEIVMEGDPYCSHCGAHFKWNFIIDEEDDSSSSYDSYDFTGDFEKPKPFLDFGEVSKTYVDADDDMLENISGMICANSAQKLQLMAVIRKYQKAPDFRGFFIKKDYEFEVYYFHFIQENEYVRTTHVMTYRQDEHYVHSPYHAFYDSYSEHNHDRLISNPRFLKVIERTGLEFDRCCGGYETDYESGDDVELTGKISIRVYFNVNDKRRQYDLDLNNMQLSSDYTEYDPTSLR